jgi:polysaccharide export outer membrane protein
MFARRLLLLIGFLIPALISCSSWNGESPAIEAEPAIALENFQLAPGDKIHLTVFGEDSITGDYEIDTEGFISAPLAGSVKAADLQKVDLERAVADKLSGLLKTPRVTVSVVSFRPFYILGEVEKPGEYPFRSGLNVVSAMAVAGGTTYRANHNRVLIQRGGLGEFKTYPMSPAIRVYPGDLIKIPERFF